MKNTHPYSLLMVLMLLTFNAHSHQLSTAYLNGHMDATGTINGNLQIRFIDLNEQVPLDANNNGSLTWQEVLNAQTSIVAWTERVLKIQRNNQPCQTLYTDPLKTDQHFNEGYLVIPVSAQCGLQGELGILYTGLMAVNTHHKMLMNLTADENNHSAVLDSKNTHAVINLATNPLISTFKTYVEQGIIHILIGYDHILFLLCLLLAIMIKSDDDKDKLTTKKRLAYSILTIITLFTLAHSLTLTLTAMQWIQLPSRWVEVGIAITVLLTAIHNIKPFLSRLKLVTFGFGLLHGMGFAGVLGELGLPADSQWLPVLAFNLGVELGQLILVALILPVLFVMAKSPRYGVLVMRSGSACIAIMAAYWVVARI